MTTHEIGILMDDITTTRKGTASLDIFPHQLETACPRQAMRDCIRLLPTKYLFAREPTPHRPGGPMQRKFLFPS